MLIGNTIEAGADIGGMAAAIAVLLPLPLPLIIIPVTAAIFALHVWGSYELIRNVFRWQSRSGWIKCSLRCAAGSYLVYLSVFARAATECRPYKNAS
jgi:uncharacterized membrane protein